MRGILEEIDYLAELLFLLVRARNVVKCRLAALVLRPLDARLAERKSSVVLVVHGVVHLAEHIEEYGAEDNEHEKRRDDIEQNGAGRAGLILRLYRSIRMLSVICDNAVVYVLLEHTDARHGEVIRLIVALELELKRTARHIEVIFRDLFFIEILHDLIILELFVLLLPGIEGDTGNYEDGNENIRYPRQHFFCIAVSVVLLIFQTSNPPVTVEVFF